MKDSSIIHYFENLARQHRLVRHSDESCHFSSILDDAQNKYAQKMEYPCVVLEMDDILWGGTLDNTLESETVSVLFVDHVTDAGDYEQVHRVFDLTGTIMRDFLRRMNRDRKRPHSIMARFNPDGAQATRIALESAGLYGWALSFAFSRSFPYLDCNHAFLDCL